MENSVYNIAVISFPRTASKSLAEWYGKKYNKPVALGSLHQPEYLGKNFWDTKDLVFSKTHILHGHWHSLDKLDEDTLECLRSDYKIVTSYREANLVYDSLLRITQKPDLFGSTMAKSLEEKQKWDIWKHHVLKGDIVETVSSAPKGFC